MNKLIRFWNLIHYCLYELQLSFHRLISYVNPISYFFKIPAIKAFYAEKRGIDDISSYITKTTFDNPKHGTSIVWAGIHIGIISLNIEVIIINIIQVILNKNFNNGIIGHDGFEICALIILMILPSLLNYIVLFKNKKYLTYFDEFDKIPRNKMALYSLLCLVTYISLLILTIYSFTWFKYN